jgi:hypothetical protein
LADCREEKAEMIYEDNSFRNRSRNKIHKNIWNLKKTVFEKSSGFGVNIACRNSEPVELKIPASRNSIQEIFRRFGVKMCFQVQ